MSDPLDVFPENLENAMDTASVNADEVAASIGVREVDVLRWVEGVDFPCPREFARLTDFLDVTRDDLLT